MQKRLGHHQTSPFDFGGANKVASIFGVGLAAGPRVPICGGRRRISSLAVAVDPASLDTIEASSNKHSGCSPHSGDPKCTHPLGLQPVLVYCDRHGALRA